MSTVLYTAPTGYGKVASALAIPVIMLLFWIAVFQLKNRGQASGNAGFNATKRRPQYGLWLLGVLFIFISASLVLQGQLDMYRSVIVPYVNGQHEQVEGYVHNFVPMPREGHSNETFDIKDVHFEYSDNNMIVGYNNARVNGGVIRGDGQYLRVGYVYYNETYGNIIVSIEELTPP